jgi:hypothetical protein
MALYLGAQPHADVVLSPIVRANDSERSHAFTLAGFHWFYFVKESSPPPWFVACALQEDGRFAVRAADLARSPAGHRIVADVFFPSIENVELLRARGRRKPPGAVDE